MRSGEGFILVYSITSRSSFDEVSAFYQQILRVKDRDAYPVVIVANKCDLQHERVVSTQEGRDLARRFNCRFIEASAKQKINVDEAFHSIVREIRRYNGKGASMEGASGKMGGSSNKLKKKKQPCTIL
jgi:GTPase KRas